MCGLTFELSTPKWLEVDRTLESFRHAGKKTRKSLHELKRGYVQWVEEEVWESAPSRLWDRMQAGLVLGAESFVQRILALARGEAGAVRRARNSGRERPGLAEVVKAVEEVKGEPLAQFKERRGDWGRDAVLLLGQEKAGCKLKALAQWAGAVDESAVSVAIRRLRQRMARHKALAQSMRRVEAALEADASKAC